MKKKTARIKPSVAKFMEKHGLNYIPFMLPMEVKSDAPRKHGSQFEATDTALLAANILCALLELSARAESGEQDAAQFLFGVSRESVIELTALSNERPELLRDFAGECPQWPVLDSLNPENRKANDEQFQKLGLASRSEVNARKSSKWNRRKPATFYALAMIEVLRANQARYQVMKKASLPAWVKRASTLPPLSKSTAKQWFDVGWQALLQEHPEPEKIKELSPIIDNTPAQRGRFKTVQGQRGEILRRVRKAMINLVRRES